MSLLNDLGDTLTVVINKAISNSSSITLIPSIIGMSYFRVISNVICVIEVDFSLTTYTLDADGNITYDKSLIAGHPDVWYTCINKNISSSVVRLVDPDNVPNNTVSITFQFVREIPSIFISTFKP
jgi:hypothetical protein